jgi:hypothetical protein
MSFFCLLWVPLLYLLRRSITDEGGAGGVWALLLGSGTALFQFFFGDIINPGGFGLSRWLSGFVDIVSLPVLIPLVVYSLLRGLRAFSGDADCAGFTLLWLIPVSALRAISYSPHNDPILLVLVPLLWTALAVGIPFFIRLITGFLRWYVVIPSLLCIAALPLMAAAAWWACFRQQPALGFPLFFATLIPMIISIVHDLIAAE